MAEITSKGGGKVKKNYAYGGRIEPLGPGHPLYDGMPAERETTTTTPPTPVRPLTVEEANQPVKDIMGEQALMGAATTDPTTGETIPGQFDLGGAEYKPTTKDIEEGELLDTTGKTLTASGVSPTGEQAADVAGVTSPTKPDASTIDIDGVERTYTSLPTSTAQTTTASTGVIIDPNQVTDTISKTAMLEHGSLAEAKTQTLAAEATTKYQIEQLMASLDAGAELPPWAAPAVRKARSIMNQRGIGVSSMAAGAMVQALMESAIPIATQDAQKYAALQIQNLNNEQATALQNAATIASMDKTNLDNRMKAAQINAGSFLQIDLSNLTNEQATETLNHQSIVQALFNDQSAANTAKQFNATSQNQVDQFYDQLGTTVANNNANREVAMNEFNTDQVNSMKKYVASLEDAREKFNANMQTLIDQSNAVWRRNVNTVNTATQNAANKSNAEAILGISVESQNNLWQKYRDEAAMAYQTSQNAQQRAHAIAVTALANQFSMGLFEAGLDADSDQRMSQFLGGLLDTVVLAGVKAFSSGSDRNTAGGAAGVSPSDEQWFDFYNNATEGTYDVFSGGDEDDDIGDIDPGVLWPDEQFYGHDY